MKGYSGRSLTLLLVLLVFLHGASARTLKEDEEHFYDFLRSALPNYSSVFNTSTPTCNWYPRVSCIGLGAQRRIFRLYLDGLGSNGSIPKNTLGALSELSVLDLSNNFLSGDIPPDIFKLSNLIHLGLANNRLTGNVSSTVSNLYQLSKLDLSGNRLSGALPGSLGSLRALKVLDLHGNKFSGSMPKLVSTTYIRYLDLSSNHVTGRVPFETFRNEELVYLNLSRNLLSGEIPKGVKSLWRLRFLDLSENDFEGAIPDLSNLGQLRTLYVSSNRLNGRFPANLTRIPYLRSLSLSSNKFSGPLPPLPWGLSSGKITLLDCSNNLLTGDIPEGLLASGNLTVFRLASNLFTGSLPSIISEKLQELDLRSNRFTGEIPETLARLHALKYLDLSENLLNGSIPWGLMEVTSLQHLSLTGNRFEEGVLPDLSQMGRLEHLNLSYSNIAGVIPASVGELKNLARLDLSHNRLNGSIPPDFFRATNLTSLDLSYNNLTGTIPPELISLIQLSRLNLSFNNLSGEVPSANLWGTLDPSSFKGNPLLCGEVVDTVCPSVAPPTPSPSPLPLRSPAPSPVTEPHGSSSKTLEVGAIIGIAVGAAVALCLCASLSTLFLFHKRKFKRIPTHDSSHLAGSVTFESDSSAWAAQVPQAASIPVIMFEKPLLNLTFADLLQATNRFHKDSMILDGGYGPTFKGILPGGLQIVVKVLYEGGPGNELEKAAQLEALGKIRHENLVSLVGYCIVRGERLLVYEFMEKGNVYQCLHDPSEEAHHPDHWTVETWVDAPEKFSATEELSWPIRHRIAVGVARALAFLHHGCSPNIVHRDVTSSNILLDSQYEPHLAECGLASLVEFPRHDTPVMGGTVGCVPPEYGQTWKATPRGDVYSFGVVLLELVTGKRPTGHFFHDSYGGNLVGWVRSLIKEKRGYKCLDPKLLATGVESEMLETLRIGYLCTAELPTKRPTMQQVVGLLKDIHVEVTYM